MSSGRSLAVLATVSILIGSCAGISSVRPPSGAPSPAAAPASAVAPICATADGISSPWWADRVFYEVFVRSFADSDGDGTGDLQGLISRLDELNDGDPATTDDLGITALWLMPVAESASYHGYDVTDYRTVERDYGTNADFKALVAAAHQRGIDIVVDLVLNHTSIEHPWFQEARKRGSAHDDWYVWADEQPSVSGPGGRPVWHPDGGRWYYGYFWQGMPDLNLANPAVAAEVDSISRFWIDEMGVDGFRLDAAKHLIEDGATLENTPATVEWLKGFRSRVHSDRTDALVLGEVWDLTQNSAKYVREGALDLSFAFELASATVGAVAQGDPAGLSAIQAEVIEDFPAGGYATFLTNHDQSRVMDELGGDIAAAKVAATILLTGPGVPFLYYGEEIGLRGRKPDERIRTPMPWTGQAPGYGFTSGAPWEDMAPGVEASNVSVQTEDPASLLTRYRALIALRAAHPSLNTGTLIPVAASDDTVYATLRHDPSGGETIAVVSNVSDEPTEDVTLSLEDGPLCGRPSLTTLLGAPGASLGAPTPNPSGGFDAWPIGQLAAHQSLIFELVP